jgi:hypothetical protein
VRPAARRLTVSAVASAVALSAAACGGGSRSTATDPGPPALAQVSTAAATPAAAAKPGPAIKAACPLLSPALIASVLGVRRPEATERRAVTTAGGTLFGCHYRSGGQYVELWVAVSALAGRADQAASLTIRRYTGTLTAVPGLGDAAYYTDSAPSGSAPRTQALVTARAEGRQMRVVTLNTFLGGRPRARIIVLARTVLERI